MQKRAWLYTHIDAPEDPNGLLKRQEKELSEYAAALGLSVVGTSSDMGLERPGLQGLLCLAAAQPMDILLAASPRHIAGDELVLEDIIRKFSSHGISLYTPGTGRLMPTKERSL